MALGKGLGAILNEVSQAYESEIVDSEQISLEKQNTIVEELEVDRITANPYQPRKHFDEQALVELSESIKTHGLLQPIVVLEKEDGYLLVAGERRLRAHKLANMSEIKAIIADVNIDSSKLRELALIENIQRENLNAIELANSYAELLEVHKITHEELSTVVHKSRSQITNTMRLLALSAYVQDKLSKGSISQGHAKMLVGMDPEQQKIIADTTIGQKLSVREVEKLVKQGKQNKKQAKKVQVQTSWIHTYKDDLEEFLPFRYKIRSNKLEIIFQDETQVQEFMEIIKKP
ncbi:MAG: chromosome partitioning protein ParB [Epsilonproteobacteria bacterium]|nr:MAG: chromosome partitioning protein ParB [Campylobacterota bacterium]